MLEYIQRLAVTIHSRTRDEDGQTLVEYALIIALVSIGSIIVLGALSGSINNVFNFVSGELGDAVGGAGGGGS